MADSKDARLFNGNRDEYRTWRNWAVVKLKTLDKVPYEKWGLLLHTWLRPPAQTWFDEMDMGLLETAGGHFEILLELDKRFPAKTREDRLGEALENTMVFKRKAGEEPAEYTGRAEMTFDRLATFGVNLPTEAKAFLILRGAPLNKDQVAVIMGSAGGKYDFDAICMSIRTSYPKGFPSGHSVNLAEDMTGTGFDHAFVAEQETPRSTAASSGGGGGSNLESRDETLVAEEWDPEDPEVFILDDQIENLTDQESEDVWEEDQVMQVLAAWADARKRLHQAKMRRGFDQKELQRPVARKPDLKAFRARARCFRCKVVGHLKRDCKATQAEIEKGREDFAKNRKSKDPGKGGYRNF
jgi:hypothetical protein